MRAVSECDWVLFATEDYRDRIAWNSCSRFLVCSNSSDDCMLAKSQWHESVASRPLHSGLRSWNAFQIDPGREKQSYTLNTIHVKVEVWQFLSEIMKRIYIVCINSANVRKNIILVCRQHWKLLTYLKQFGPVHNLKIAKIVQCI